MDTLTHLITLSVSEPIRHQITSLRRNRGTLGIDALNRVPPGGQLEYRCALAFGQISEQHDLAARKFQGIVMRDRII